MYCDATKESGDYGRLINHSKKKANCYLKVYCIDQEVRLVIKAKQQIKPGEELLYPYGDTSPKSLEDHPWLKE